MDQAIDYASRVGRCLRPALSSLRDGARKTVSALRASIAIALGNDLKREAAVGLHRSIMLALISLPVMLWVEPTIMGGLIAAYAAIGLLMTAWLIREVEKWAALSRRVLDDWAQYIREAEDGEE